MVMRFKHLIVAMIALQIQLANANTNDKPANPDFRLIQGCFDISYRFVEDGQNDTTLNTRERIDFSNDGATAKLHHYIVQSNSLQKHFREEWTADDALWNQAIVGPDETLRYQCKGRFVGTQWRCRVMGTPKPRRDMVRTDYDFLDRDTTLQLTPNDWIQSEVNDKRKVDGSFVANEVGWIVYHRLTEDQCPPRNQ